MSWDPGPAQVTFGWTASRLQTQAGPVAAGDRGGKASCWFSSPAVRHSLSLGGMASLLFPAGLRLIGRGPPLSGEHSALQFTDSYVKLIQNHPPRHTQNRV